MFSATSFHLLIMGFTLSLLNLTASCDANLKFIWSQGLPVIVMYTTGDQSMGLKRERWIEGGRERECACVCVCVHTCLFAHMCVLLTWKSIGNGFILNQVFLKMTMLARIYVSVKSAKAMPNSTTNYSNLS